MYTQLIPHLLTVFQLASLTLWLWLQFFHFLLQTSLHIITTLLVISFAMLYVFPSRTNRCLDYKEGCWREKLWKLQKNATLSGNSYISKMFAIAFCAYTLLYSGSIPSLTFKNLFVTLDPVSYQNFNLSKIFCYTDTTKVYTLSVSCCLISSRSLLVTACWSDKLWAFCFWNIDNSSSSCNLSCCNTAILFHSWSLTSCTLRSNSLFYSSDNHMKNEERSVPY